MPALGSSKPAIIRSVVVLPDPEGPSMVKNSPRSISRSIPATATTSPYCLVRPARRMSGGESVTTFDVIRGGRECKDNAVPVDWTEWSTGNWTGWRGRESVVLLARLTGWIAAGWPRCASARAAQNARRTTDSLLTSAPSSRAATADQRSAAFQQMERARVPSQLRARGCATGPLRPACAAPSRRLSSRWLLARWEEGGCPSERFAPLAPRAIAVSRRRSSQSGE